MKSSLSPLSDEQRKQFHAIFNEWHANASESDYEMLSQAREHLWPGHVCSMVTLVRSCLDEAALQALLPQSLVEQLRALNWPQLFVAAKAS